MRSNRSHILLSIAILLCLSQKSTAQHTVLWKITRPGHPQVSWLAGTFHTLGESFIDSFPIIKEKLLASELFISEAPTDRKAILDAIDARPATDTLKSMVSAQELDQIKEIYHKSSENIFKLTPSELLQQLIVFYYEYGCYPPSLNDKYTVDEYLQQLARDNQKPAYFFETDSMQNQLLANKNANWDWKYFHKRVGAVLSLYKMKRPMASVCKLVWDYVNFKVDYDFDKACTDKDIVEERNAAWMSQLPALLDQHNCFVDVGMQHLCNRCGLIVQLKAQGYVVEPVPMQ
jgi:uncharacterized protein YbaP (TraB family)